jgi:hypothetical protein
VSEKLCDRWFDNTHPDSYRSRLSHSLTDQELTQIEKQLRRQSQNQTVAWQSTQLFLTAHR